MSTHRAQTLVSLLFALALASIATESDGAPLGSFTAMRRIPGLDSEFRDLNPNVSTDGRTVYFVSDRPHTGRRDFTQFDIFTAKRGSVEEPFGPASKVPPPISLDGISEGHPHVLPDGKTMYFQSSREGDVAVTWVTKRENETSAWGEPDTVEGNHWSLMSQVVDVADANVSDDELQIFFHSDRTGTRDIFRTSRKSDSETFGPAEPLDGVNTVTDGEMSPSLSSDQLTLFYVLAPNDSLFFTRMRVATRSSPDEPFGNSVDLNDFGLGSMVNREDGATFSPQVSADWPKNGSKLYYGFATDDVDWDLYEVTWTSALQAGDANQDLKFDQLDLVQVQITGKYLTSEAATWGEGDWDGAPGGRIGGPPRGNGRFDQQDIVAALQAAIYLSGPYDAVQRDGQRADGQTSIGYNATTGEMWVDAPAGTELTSINVDSAAGIFIASAAESLGGSFDNDSDTSIFKATFGGSFGTLSFGNVAQPGLSNAFLLGDLSVVGSLNGGGGLGDVDLMYIPEPASLLLTVAALVGLLSKRAGIKKISR